MTRQLLMGNAAFAHAALEAGVGVVAGYPGTPSSELIETVAACVQAGTATGVHVEWSTNEKAALELACAASAAGKRALFTCKQVGLNVASDALMSFNYLGCKGGLVLFVADDPGPISSQTEQDTRRFAAFAKVPVLDPATPEQGFAMMKAAFELSERFATPVIVRPTTRIDHASTFFDIRDTTCAAPEREGGWQRDPKWVIFPKRAYEAHGEVNERLNEIAALCGKEEPYAGFNPVYGDANAKLGIACGGVSTQYAREALELLEREAAKTGAALPAVRLMQVGVPYPFPSGSAMKFAYGLSDVLVLEELDFVIEDELLKLAGSMELAPQMRIHGKLTDEAPTRGENSTELLARAIAAFMDAYGDGSGNATQLVEDAIGDKALTSFSDPLPVRPPVLCAGCPHRGSFYAVKRALKKLGVAREDAILCGDIGCYTLGNAAPLNAVDTCLCMGADITMAQGFAAAGAGKKQVAFIGDSTFFASGMTGVANAVYNQHDITICVLDNSTTAMTGSQPHPGTGATLMGGLSEPLQIDAVLRALGVKVIEHANPLHHEEAVATAMRALEAEGVSALIFESPCVWLQKPDIPVEVSADACTGCKRCITEIGCPALGFDLNATGPKSGTRGQAAVDESLCNGCALCTQICPVGAIKLGDRHA